MYIFLITLLLLVFPLAATAVDVILHPGAGIVMLAGKWFTFFPVGVRLFLAGVRQTTQPSFTAAKIFKIADVHAHPIVREVGFANLAMGTLGLASLAVPAWLVPAALVGGLYYGLAGLGHAINAERNAKEQFALISDLLIFLALAAFVANELLR